MSELAGEPARPSSSNGDLTQRLLAFGRELRAEGVTVGTGSILEFCRAASLLGPADLYWAGRATLVARQEEIPIYDRIFYRFWGGDCGQPVQVSYNVEQIRVAAESGEDSMEERGRKVSPAAVRASRLELLREKSFAELTPEELAELTSLIARIRMCIPTRRSRRRRPARVGSPDLRRTIRRSFRTGGEPVERAWRDRRRRRRRIVLILDVSGSMASYSRGLALFAHAVLRSDTRWEAFCFGTRLTRVTNALATVDPDVALERVADEVWDWDGGTRIGDSLKGFLDRFGHSGMARGAIVIICSDGLEVGEPVVLDEQMKRLWRLAYRVIWLNPLKGQAGYQPLARGMQAALPYVDVFSTAHNLASLEALAAELSAL
jgi:uncharacterized protein